MPLPCTTPPFRIRYRIRALRRAQGISPSRLAEVLGKTRGWLAQAERGELALSIEQLICLARLLGVRHFWDLVDVEMPPTLADDLRQARRALRESKPSPRRKPRG